ncbi:SDR family NAD(P)-dependent oxidoreductase [Micropruina sonneratiae]|uniref:SDR family NAD(P)-dependent oxidoreductase n=1 Tax=Micropruina sonneratiae TaxID=2986940 RepID=UPI0022261476|nr:SDR family NAD(P)-dependent oxidoreductase [Micropruina sp. KQZ13P-5]MCW3158147.1 SDR family NAD(P)-dependent oxidoreductase [Micropruina sp. KQZ13P-5]
MKDRLTPLTIPSRKGRLAIVTGASSGVGKATARALGLAGADVVLAVRNVEKGEAVAAELLAEHPEGSHTVAELDTSDLGSVASFADQFADRHVDILVLNAGIGGTRKRQESVDGHELVMATNYFGHFALTARLLDALRRASRARVVALGSIAARAGHIRPDDLDLTRGWSSSRAYSNSKLAMVMFARELQRRSSAAEWGLNAHAAHPGWSVTGLFPDNPLVGVGQVLAGGVHLMQSAADGAQPVVFCAASRQAAAGGYYGPIGPLATSGPVGRAPLPRRARSERALTALWEATEELTGLSFPR